MTGIHAAAAGGAGAGLHFIAGEYPPQLGGVADYTALVARAYAARGVSVHVWAPGSQGVAREDGVIVHRTCGRFTGRDLAAVDAELDGCGGARRLLVQWVPQSFGHPANLLFPRWLLRRRKHHHDRIDLMVHEPFLPFSTSPRRAAAAVLHRIMIAMALRAAHDVWLSTPAWEAFLKPFAPRPTSFRWLPVPSTVGTLPPAAAPRADERGGPVTAFATGGGGAFDMFRHGVLPALAARGRPLLLIGRRSVEWAERLARGSATVPVEATGEIPADAISRCLATSVLGVQPFIDGVCGRHTTAMAFLAHGCPLLTTAGRFTEPVWERSGGVALVPAGGAPAMQAAVAGLLASPERRDVLGAAGARLYSEHFDVRHVVDALMAAS